MQRTQSAAQAVDLHLLSALGGIRTPNLLIRSQTALRRGRRRRVPGGRSAEVVGAAHVGLGDEEDPVPVLEQAPEARDQRRDLVFGHDGDERWTGWHGRRTAAGPGGGRGDRTRKRPRPV